MERKQTVVGREVRGESQVCSTIATSLNKSAISQQGDVYTSEDFSSHPKTVLSGTAGKGFLLTPHLQGNTFGGFAYRMICCKLGTKLSAAAPQGDVRGPICLLPNKEQSRVQGLAGAEVTTNGVTHGGTMRVQLVLQQCPPWALSPHQKCFSCLFISKLTPSLFKSNQSLCNCPANL